MNVKLLCIDEGHTLSGSDYGAKGNGLFESIETRALGKLVEKYAKELGTTVDKCTVDTASSVADSITKRVALANKRAHDLLLIIHFNAFGQESANGCEVFILPYSNVYSSKASYEKNLAYGNAILDSVCAAGGFAKRGGAVKFRNDLGMLCNTKDHSVYLEVCFLTNKSDADKYKANKDKIARAIAEIITGKNLNKKIETVVEERKFDMKNLVVYGNSVDRRAAEYLADYLQCPTLDGNIPFDYSKVEKVYCVGGKPSLEWTGYAKKIITGKDRYDTIIQVLKFIKKI